MEPIFEFFDPGREVAITERRLPHWAQAGTVCFITWRTEDSMPRAVMEAWMAERNAWLARRGIDAHQLDWKEKLARLPISEQYEYRRKIWGAWELRLDECHGECVLRRPALASLVAESLRFFEGERYTLSDYVVMPNHVHVLAAFPTPDLMLKQCTSWKHFTAVQINKALGRRGRFWEVDGFDHLVRSPEQFEYLRAYIAQNPVRARLRQGEYLH